MPWNRDDYPLDWEAIRARILERADNRCEWPGCSAEHCVWYHRGSENREIAYACAAQGPDCSGRDVDEYRRWVNLLDDPVRVVLTVAHTCQESSCADEAHLRAWCQLHHLRYDARQHAASAARTRRQRRVSAGQTELLR